MFAIVRHSKHHSLGTIGASASHTMRTRRTLNANPSGPAPEVWAGTEDPAADVRALLPEKRRKNAVLSLEYLVSASPEFFKEKTPDVWRSYLREQLEMLENYYGKENIASAVLHQDETSPHLAVQIVPLLNGKLNARELIGTREACSIIQDLAGDVGKSYGLSRGVKGSKAKHLDIRKWYETLEPKMQAAKEIIDKADKVLESHEKSRAELANERKTLHDAREMLSRWEEKLGKQYEFLDEILAVLPSDVQEKIGAVVERSQKQPERPATAVAPARPSTSASRVVNALGGGPGGGGSVLRRRGPK